MPGKVTIIGAGNVGTATAFALAIDGSANNIVLLDRNLEKAKGEIMDIEHGSAFMPHTEFMGSKSYKDIKDSDIVVITAGAAQAPGESRLQLLQRNAGILKGIMKDIKTYSPDSIVIVVTNPVDVLTYLALKYSHFPHNRVFGTGTVLDSARFRSYLAKYFCVNAHNVHAHILGEHGDSSFPALSTANIGSIPLRKMPHYNEKAMWAIHHTVRTVVYDIIKKKGSTNLAIATCVTQLVHAILNDTHEIFPVSSVLRGEYGIHDVAVSTPSVLGKCGIIQELEIPLDAKEKAALKKSVKILKKAIRSVHHPVSR
ncbi:MAG: L-lactate dehydrogenase [Patescibacteria group bacterium]|jgi:L-lactate dehydrogenase